MIHDVQYDEYIGADVPNTQHTIGLIPDTRYTICLIFTVGANVPTPNTIDLMLNS